MSSYLYIFVMASFMQKTRILHKRTIFSQRVQLFEYHKNVVKGIIMHPQSHDTAALSEIERKSTVMGLAVN